MKAILFVLIASLFASEFQTFDEDEIKIGKVIKKVVPVVKKVYPVIRPFLAEELDTVEEDFEEDEINWGTVWKVGKFIIKVAAEFLGEEDEFVNPCIGKVNCKRNPLIFYAEEEIEDEDGKINWGKVIGVGKKILTIVRPFLGEEMTQEEIDEINWAQVWSVGKKIIKIAAEFLGEEELDTVDYGYEDEINWGTVWNVGKKIIKIGAQFLGDEEAQDEFNLKKAIKKAKKVISVGKKVYPYVKPFLAEEDQDEFSLKKTVKKAKKVISVGKKVYPYIKPFLAEEDQDEMILNMTNPFAPRYPHRRPVIIPAALDGKINWGKVLGVAKKIIKTVEPFLGEEEMDILMEEDEEEDEKINWGKVWGVTKTIIKIGAQFLSEEEIEAIEEEAFDEMDEINWKKVISVGKKVIKTVEPFLGEEEAQDEFSLKKIVKGVKKVVSVGKKVYPYVKPFLAE